MSKRNWLFASMIPAGLYVIAPRSSAPAVKAPPRPRGRTPRSEKKRPAASAGGEARDGPATAARARRRRMEGGPSTARGPATLQAVGPKEKRVPRPFGFGRLPAMNLAAIVLAAGQGTRMKSARPKV